MSSLTCSDACDTESVLTSDRQAGVFRILFRNFVFFVVRMLPSNALPMSTDLFEQRKKKLVRYYQRYHQLPTYDELVGLFEVNSKGSLHKYIQKFVEEGYIGKSAGGKLIPTSKLYGLRVLGTVQAGFPSSTEEESNDTMSIDEFLINNPQATYMLKVSGDSMINAGIMEGDLVIVDRSKTPKSGDIVVAEVDGEWTMKYLIKRANALLLRAANTAYPDIHPRQEMKIGGVVTSVIRKY